MYHHSEQNMHFEAFYYVFEVELLECYSHSFNNTSTIRLLSLST